MRPSLIASACTIERRSSCVAVRPVRWIRSACLELMEVALSASSAQVFDKDIADVTSSSITIDSSILGFIAGFVDTCVFVGLFGLFTAHVTGNFARVHEPGDET